MSDPQTQEELMKQFEDGEIPENTFSNEYSDKSLLKIIEVEFGIVGVVPSFKDIAESNWAGKSIVRLTVNVVKSDNEKAVGIQTRLITPLFTKSGNYKLHSGWVDKETNKYQPASLLGEIIHKMKEHNPDQWDKSPFSPKKLKGMKGCMFKMDTKEGAGYLFVGSEQQVATDKWKEEQAKNSAEGFVDDMQKDRDKKAQKPRTNKENRETVEKGVDKAAMDKEAEEERIDPDDLPF